MNEAATPADRIRRLADGAGVSQDTAAFAADQLYPQVDNDGGYADAAVPATLYAAVRIQGDPVRPQEIADATDVVDADRLMKDMRRLVRTLPFDVEVEGGERRYVERVVDDLGEGDQFRVTALSLCDDAIDDGVNVGKSPAAFAAAVVYAASVILDADVEQKAVAEAAGVNVRGVRKNYRDVIAASTDTTAATHDDLPAIVDDVMGGIDGAVPSVVREDAREMAEAIDPDADWVRRCDPKAVAAAVVYVAAKRHRVDITQAEAGEAVGVSRHAVNARSQDVRDWDTRRRLDDCTYNRLKELAAEHGIDVGPTPERPALVDRLADAGVDA